MSEFVDAELTYALVLRQELSDQLRLADALEVNLKRYRGGVE